MGFKFKDVFTGTQSALRSSPEKAVATFSAHSRLETVWQQRQHPTIHDQGR